MILDCFHIRTMVAEDWGNDWVSQGLEWRWYVLLEYRFSLAGFDLQIMPCRANTDGDL